MNTRMRKCIICGKEYEYCGTCSDTSNQKETWRNLYCSENCKQIFEVLSAYAFEHIDAQEAQKKLGALDLSKIDSFKDSFKKQIEEIRNKSSIVTNKETLSVDKFQKQEQSKEIVKNDSKKNKFKI